MRERCPEEKQRGQVSTAARGSKEQIPDLVADSEIGQQASMSLVFPTIEIEGCIKPKEPWQALQCKRVCPISICGFAGTLKNRRNEMSKQRYFTIQSMEGRNEAREASVRTDISGPCGVEDASSHVRIGVKAQDLVLNLRIVLCT